MKDLCSSVDLDKLISKKLKKRWTLEGDSSYITKEHAKKYCHGKRGKIKKTKIQSISS
jgi:hypothetical protein